MRNGKWMADSKHNAAMLKKKFPAYLSDVDYYIKHNPNEHLIRILIMLCSCNDTRTDSYLIFNHCLGGGASIFLETLAKELLLKNSSLIIVCPKEDGYMLQYAYNRYYYEWRVECLSTIFYFARLLHISDVVVNELVSYPNPYQALASIRKLKKDISCRITFYLHDFYCICPGILLSANEHYCNLPDLSVCKKCPSGTSSLSYLRNLSIEEWRKNWGRFLSRCDSIIAFSHDSIDKLNKVYPGLTTIQCIPHQVAYVTPVEQPPKKPGSPLIIGILGLLTQSKGAAIVRDMISLISYCKLNIKIVLIGKSGLTTTDSCYYEHGMYNKNDISELTKRYQIDVFFLPFIYPETFSFATEEAMKTTLPVAVFDIGAPAERIRTYPRGILIPTPTASCALENIIEYMNGRE